LTIQKNKKADSAPNNFTVTNRADQSRDFKHNTENTLDKESIFPGIDQSRARRTAKKKRNAGNGEFCDPISIQ
jgi:hypothetical protein